MKDNNRVLFLSVIAVVLLILIAIGATYAYFQNQIENTTNIDVSATTTSETEVEYVTGADLNLVNAEPGNSIETVFNIDLTASNKTDDTVTYGINWIIDSNNFVYEPENASDPQLVYSIYYSADNSSWTALKENQDCTTSTGTISLASNQQLTATVNTTVTVYWKVVIEYKAYDYNQATNMTKSLKGHIEVTGLDE